MRLIKVAIILVTVGVSAAIAQQRRSDSDLTIPRFDLSLGYNNIRANAPPGGCQCFDMNGGYLSAGYHVKNWFSIAGEFTGGHANNISLLGQNLTLMTFMAGPRVSYRTGHRFVPFGQVLFGGAHGSDSYFPTATSSTSSASSWALTGGGGLDVNLTHRFAVRALEVQYLRTALPNGTNDAQNHFSIGAGIVIKFGGRHESSSAPVVAQQQHNDLSFTCTTNIANIDQGQVLEIIGNTMTEPDRLDVNYSWSSNGGTIEGTGRRVTINTTGMAPGNYRVTGHASLVSSPDTSADCEAAFRVRAASSSVATASNQSDNADDKVFHENVQDALFDYDSYKIRADAQVAIDHAAQYLKANPQIRVLIGGYSDERGSAEYNLALGEKRADAARKALIADGVDGDRLQIISYGKEAQVCTAANETCWQQNRRAAFSMHH